MLQVRIARFPGLVRGSWGTVKSALARHVLPASAPGYSVGARCRTWSHRNGSSRPLLVVGKTAGVTGHATTP